MERVSVKMLEGFEHVVFHRPSYNKRFQHALSCCHKTSVSIHADYDDLIFHPDFAEHSPLYLTGNRRLENVVKLFKKNHQAAQYFKSFILSTDYLCLKVQNIFAGVETCLLHNSLHRLFIHPKSQVNGDTPLTIGYFPGSHGHGEDFNSIASVLNKIVADGVRLLIVGRLDNRYYNNLSNVVHIPFSNYSKYLYCLANVDVSIAPLTSSIFNDSKSAVKLIESVAVSTPIVASSNGDMIDHQNSMATLLDNNDDWYQALMGCLVSSRETNNESVATELANRYSVNARIPVLRDYLQCV